MASSHSQTSGMSPFATDLCRTVAKTLMSEEHSKKNFLFLEPVDVAFHPTYLDVVKRPMDLGTLGQNLDAGKYSNTEVFFVDTMLCFENALTFHAKNRDMQWIIRLAKDMMKLVVKEKRIVDKKVKEANKSERRASGASKLASKKSSKTKKEKDDGTTTDPKKGTEKTLKLKQPTGAKRGKQAPAVDSVSTTSSAPIATQPKLSKPKVALKLKPTNGTSETATKDSNKRQLDGEKKQKVPKQKISKPKLKLSLSLPKKTAVTTSAAASQSPTLSTPVVPKIRLSAPSRGKELPKGVSSSTSPPSKLQVKAPKNNKTTSSKKQESSTQTKKTKKQTSQKLPQSPSKVAPAPAGGSGTGTTGQVVGAMNPKRTIQCMKVLSGLKRRKFKDMVWFQSPISDKIIIDDYRAKIPSPMDLGTLSIKLEKNQYVTIADFVFDLRRIFANCLRYNTTIQDSFRPLAVDILTLAEELLASFVAKPETPSVVYPPLLYCWKLCVSILDAVTNITNPTDGHQTAHYFMHPVSFYFGGVLPQDYLSKVKRPIDLGTVTSTLLEGKYYSVQSFATDCLLVNENCIAYYGGTPEGGMFTEQAGRLHALMKHQLDALMRYDQSNASAPAKAAYVSLAAVLLPKPPPTFLLSILKDLRAVKYTDKFTKITELVLIPFEKSVNLALYSDYLQVIQTPMEFETIENRVKGGMYEAPEDFEHDVMLVFQNCEAYNAPRRSDHMVAMGKYGAKMFRKLFSARMRSIEDPESMPPQKQKVEGIKKEQKRSLSSPTDHEKESKKPRIDVENKAAPRISIAASCMSSNIPITGGKAPRSISPKNTGGTPQKRKSTTSVTIRNANAPVPLHVAIAQVKERFPLRRPYKLLQSWEGACARFFRELMKHPWINAARPKFIFHVPVPVLFPELKEGYASKITKPMDLTTAEAKLLQGGLYHSAQLFVDEVALVFANAITFNRDGHEVGESMSCAYFDASTHLLRYTRWLSLELLAEYLSDDLYVNEIDVNGMPPTSWKLCTGNRTKGREEMETIFLNEIIEKSLEGDRFTWMEAEAEKLLKSLRHQSDLRYMTFFIQANYPADYSAYIAKPMDWERVHRSLRKRAYDKLGDVVEDIRLIFSNALKYNARGKGTETVSGKAYDAAVYMSKKLEVAIDKAMLSVSDRLERERIDHNIAEMEIEAAEIAENARLREMWSKQRESGGDEAEPAVETIERVRVVNRRQNHRKEMMDFDYPYFDEDDGNQEQSHIDSQRQQRSIFERQRKSRVVMRSKALATGTSVFDRLAKQSQAIAIAKSFAEKAAKEKAASCLAKIVNGDSTAGTNPDNTGTGTLGSSVLLELSKEGRSQISIRPKARKQKKQRKGGKLFSLD